MMSAARSSSWEQFNSCGQDTGLHNTSTYSSWLNQVERSFALITQRAIRLGSFHSVKELVERRSTPVFGISTVLTTIRLDSDCPIPSRLLTFRRTFRYLVPSEQR